MQQNLQNKKGLVQSVFDRVFDKYDIMNDFMSLGIHRIWKKNLIIFTQMKIIVSSWTIKLLNKLKYQKKLLVKNLNYC